MANLYLVPLESDGANHRGPKYFSWRFDPDPPALMAGVQWGLMDYGFLPSALLAADTDAGQHATLSGLGDVYAFPANLDAPITDPTIDAFFETLHIPTNWLTPSTTYRELLRYTAGMFQFNQVYGTISQGQSILGDGVTLNTRWNQLSQQQRDWFLATLVHFGWTDGVAGNPQLRTLARQAGDLWGESPFHIGGMEI